MGRFSISVLISGSGSTLLNLLERCDDGRLMAQVCGVIASRDCSGLEHARRFGVPSLIVPRQVSPAEAFDASEFSLRVASQLQQWQPDLVVLAGFLSHFIPPPQLAQRVVNIHPALLPQFGGKGMYGVRVHEAVLKSGTKLSGCTVHLVDDVYDQGAILAQRAVSVMEDDDVNSLAARVQSVERDLLPEVINWFIEGRISFDSAGKLKLSGRNLLGQPLGS